MNFAPKADWQPLTSGTGQSNGGVWLTAEGWVVKRLLPGVTDPRHHAYWERQALVAESGILARTPGLRCPKYMRVMRDAEGISLLSEYVESAPIDAIDLALALGRFAKAPIEEPEWGARDVLRDRLRTVEARGGWASLLELEELEEPLRRALRALWVRRYAALDELDALPRAPAHGDVHPLNLRGRHGRDVIAFDWEQFGFAPAGFDLGYLAIAVALPLDEAVFDEEGFDDLVLAVDCDSLVRRGAVLTAALTAASRAAWSLDQPSPGDHLDRLLALTPLITEAADA
jgi:hypothetical protein